MCLSEHLLFWLWQSLSVLEICVTSESDGCLEALAAYGGELGTMSPVPGIISERVLGSLQLGS